jgi:uncharacterized membrane protein
VANILQSLNRTIIAGIILTFILLIIIFSIWPGSSAWLSDSYFWGTVVFRYLHVLSGIMWIGLLWYFNFVQIPNMPNIPNEQKPAIAKVIAPAALFWFRWAALSTIITGLIVAYLGGYVDQAMTLGLIGETDPKSITIGIGMWLGIIMAYNVWMVIWPNQKKALGIIDATAEEKAKSARTAMLFSRANTLLSIPMLLTMVGAQNLY